MNDDREELDNLLCGAYPDQDGFSIGDVLDVVIPWLDQVVSVVAVRAALAGAARSAEQR